MTYLPLFVPRRKQRGVVEKYLDGGIEITNEIVPIEECELDRPRGVKRFRGYTSGKDYVVVRGIAQFVWRGEEGRLLCEENQKSKNGRTEDGSRWTDIVSIAEAILSGTKTPLPALVHPSLHEYEGLMIIDGARRVVAHVEAGLDSFAVAVIKKDDCRGSTNC